MTMSWRSPPPASKMGVVDDDLFFSVLGFSVISFSLCWLIDWLIDWVLYVQVRIGLRVLGLCHWFFWFCVCEWVRNLLRCSWE
jgi:hypothetical protein